MTSIAKPTRRESTKPFFRHDKQIRCTKRVYGRTKRETGVPITLLYAYQWLLRLSESKERTRYSRKAREIPNRVSPTADRTHTSAANKSARSLFLQHWWTILKRTILLKTVCIFELYTRPRINARFLLFLLLRVESVAIIIKLSLSIHDLH